MNATAYFIADRAQTLAYEAIQFPDTAKTAYAWLDRAVDTALKIRPGGLELALELESIMDRIRDHYAADAMPEMAA